MKKEKPKPLPPGKYTGKVISDLTAKSVYVEITEGKFKGKRFDLGPTEWYFPKIEEPKKEPN